jgi:hypothetical protein
MVEPGAAYRLNTVEASVAHENALPSFVLWETASPITASFARGEPVGNRAPLPVAAR